MAILAAAVCTRGGKVLLSRQFVDLGAERVQELFSKFPKLAQAGSQHTTAEDEDVRFVYEPLEELYVVVVTDLQSNILQDIRTLRLVAQCVASYVPAGDEKDVVANAFDLISAFDEIVSLGFTENLTLAQVETFLEMESHEEKIQEIIERNKELEAAEERKKKARQLEQQRKTRGLNSTFDSTYGDGSQSPFIQSTRTTAAFDQVAAQADSLPGPPASRFAEKRTSTRGGKGLQLGKKKTAREEVPLLAELERAPAARPAPPARAESRPAVEGTEVSIAESLTIEATRDGSIRSSRVSGTLHLYAADRDNSRIRIHTKTGGAASAYKTNPKMDRALFAKEQTLGLKSADEAFPASNVLLVKWTVDNVAVPVIFNVWISESSDPGFMSVTVEYELAEDFEGTLENVGVDIPIPSSNAHVLDPSSVYDQFDDYIQWMIPVASRELGKESGSFEFTAEADSEDQFLPMQVSFIIRNAKRTFGDIDVLKIVNAAEGIPVEYRTIVETQTDSYIIR